MSTPIASWRPFGLGLIKPHHYRDMLRVGWENRDQARYAWRILSRGVCDGCSLGAAGLRDDTLPGIHLCMVRLKMLRLNTMPALDPRRLADVASLRSLSNGELRRLGRLAHPMIRSRGETGFRRLTWDEALEIGGEALATTQPRRIAIYTTSRGLTNEVYYVAAKFARVLGTNNIDNAARLCHAASTAAMKQTLGVAASTCSYTDWIGSELVVLFGTNLANNQPVAVKYLHRAKRKGARIVVVNPFREPGLERYWIPSKVKSALFGTQLMDEHYPVRVGGDVAFINGVLKILIQRNQIDTRFIRGHTAGFDEFKARVIRQPWKVLETASGVPRLEMERFAETYSRVQTAVFIWSMGLTQHEFGVQNVQAVVNLALARGMVGRKNCGLVPIRGHSGVQGAAECGSVPASFPGGFPVNEENAQRFAGLWGHEPPAWKGLEAPQMLEAAHRSELDVLYNLGGNFLETMPEPGFVRAAFDRLKLRIHQDVTLNTSMLLDSDAVLLLPGLTRYEQPGGGTSTSTERRIRYSPEIPGPRPGEARCEWGILCDLAQRALPAQKRAMLAFRSGEEIRREMDRVMPNYRGIGALRREGDAMQYGGPCLLEGGVCGNLPDQRARFTPLDPPVRPSRPRRFYLATRRGSQFNSMIFDTVDPLTGAARHDVLISPLDASALGVQPGDPIRLRSEQGEFAGRARLAAVSRGCLLAHWPEANVLIPRRSDPGSGEPDYNVEVSLEKIKPES